MTQPVPATWLDGFFASPGGPPNAAAATLILGPSSPRWSLVQPDEVVTLPVAPAPGVTYDFTHSGTTLAGHPVLLQRPSGASYLIQVPADPNNLGGSSPPAASVPFATNNATLRLRFDGGALMRVV